MSKDFMMRFPQLDPAHILSELSSPRPFSAIIPSKDLRGLYLEAITYLLARDYVTQLHMYIYILIPDSIVKRVKASMPMIETDINDRESESVNFENDLTQDESLIIPSAEHTEPHHHEMIRIVALTQPAPIAKLFLK